MIILFFNDIESPLLDFKPSNQSDNSKHLVNNVLVPLKQNVKASDLKKTSYTFLCEL